MTLLFLSALVCAQELGEGMEISGFRVPDYDDAGRLRAQLFGEHAKVLDDGRVEIINLKIVLYKEGQYAATVFAPNCFFNIDTRDAHSDGPVLVESDLMTLTGRGFSWSAASGFFEVLHDSKVLIKKEARSGMKEFSL